MRQMRVLGLLLIGLSACDRGDILEIIGEVRSGDGAAVPGSERIPFEVFTDDVGDRNLTERRVLLKTRDAYQTFFGHAPPAAVDFDREWVIFYAAGQQAQHRVRGLAAIAGPRRHPPARGHAAAVARPDCIVGDAITAPHVLVKFRAQPDTTLGRLQPGHRRLSPTNPCGHPVSRRPLPRPAARQSRSRRSLRPSAAPGTHCEARPVTCVRAPCPPVAECVPDGPFCGGIAGIRCPGGGTCEDNPGDSCDPRTRWRRLRRHLQVQRHRRLLRPDGLGRLARGVRLCSSEGSRRRQPSAAARPAGRANTAATPAAASAPPRAGRASRFTAVDAVNGVRRRRLLRGIHRPDPDRVLTSVGEQPADSHPGCPSAGTSAAPAGRAGVLARGRGAPGAGQPGAPAAGRDRELPGLAGGHSPARAGTSSSRATSSPTTRSAGSSPTRWRRGPAHGVKVRVLYDWLGTWGARRLWSQLRAAGAEVRCFNPPRLDSPFGWVSRDHRKTIAVDGEIGFVSGLCVSARWLGDPKRGVEPWRDTGIEIRGPAVADLEEAFARIWASTGTPIARRGAGPRPRRCRRWATCRCGWWPPCPTWRACSAWTS